MTNQYFILQIFLFTLFPLTLLSEICFYTQENFQGPSACLQLNETLDFCNTRWGGCQGSWNDRTRSISFSQEALTEGYVLRVYERFRFEGRHLDITSTQSNLNEVNTFFNGPGGGGGITSAEVHNRHVSKPDVCLYTSNNWYSRGACLKMGESIDFCDEKWGGCNGIWNDNTRSIYFTKNALDNGYKLRVFERLEGRGRHYDINENRLNIDDINAFFNGPGGGTGITTAQLHDSTLVSPDACMYTSENWYSKGACLNIGETIDLCQPEYGGCNGDWNDQIQSVWFYNNSTSYLQVYDESTLTGCTHRINQSERLLTDVKFGISSGRLV